MATYTKHLRRRTKLGARNRGGSLITAIINFMIIALSVFLITKTVNKIKDLSDAENESIIDTKPKPPTVEQLLTEICDELLEDRN